MFHPRPSSLLLLPARAAILLVLGASLASPVHVGAVNQAADRLAIPATDEGLPGAGPIRRDEWFQRLWRERRSGWARQVELDRHAVVFLGDSITQGWGGGLGAAFPGALGREPRHQRRHHARRPPEARGGRSRARPGGGRPAHWHERSRGGRRPGDDRRQPQAPRRRPGAARSPHAHRAVPGVPELVDDEAPGRSDQGRERALSGGGEERRPGHLRGDLAALRRSGGDAIPAEFPDLLHPNEAGYAKWAAALRPVFATLGLSETADDPFRPEEGFLSLFNGHDLTGWATGRPPRRTRRARCAGRPRTRAPPPGRSSRRGSTSTASRPRPTDASPPSGGRLVVTTPPEYRKIQQIWTTREFSRDFILKLEFRATPNADSGVYLRGPAAVSGLRPGRPLPRAEALPAAGVERDRGHREGRRGRLHLQRRGARGRARHPGGRPDRPRGGPGQMEYRRIRIKSVSR